MSQVQSLALLAVAAVDCGVLGKVGIGVGSDKAGEETDRVTTVAGFVGGNTRAVEGLFFAVGST